MCNQGQQNDELVVLSSIYSEETICVNDERKSGSFFLNVQLPQPFTIIANKTGINLSIKEHCITSTNSGAQILPLPFLSYTRTLESGLF